MRRPLELPLIFDSRSRTARKFADGLVREVRRRMGSSVQCSPNPSSYGSIGGVVVMTPDTRAERLQVRFSRGPGLPPLVFLVDLSEDEAREKFGGLLPSSLFRLRGAKPGALLEPVRSTAGARPLMGHVRRYLANAATPQFDWKETTRSLGRKPRENAATPQNVAVTTAVDPAVRPGGSFQIEVVLHLPSVDPFEDPASLVIDEADRLALVKDTPLLLELAPPQGFTLIDPRPVPLRWDPPLRRAPFPLQVAQDQPEGRYFVLGYIRLAEGHEQELSRFSVEVRVQQTARPGQRAARRQAVAIPRTAFASYSRLDGDRVGDRVSSLESAGLSVFKDNLDIREGADWEEVIKSELISKDGFFLFWSCNASRSEWVEKEWRTALAERGLQYIRPSALETRCPPPEELETLQFGGRPQS